MVISRRVLRRNRLRPHLLGFDSREDLSHPCTTVYALALLLAVEQQRSQPPLSIAPSWACVISLTVPAHLVAGHERPGIVCSTAGAQGRSNTGRDRRSPELEAHDALSAMRPA